MHLHLQNIVPTHLAARQQGGNSPIWGRNLTLAPKSRVLVQAPSGTGKTTLIHILYGMNRDYTGNLGWDGTSVATASDKVVSAARTDKLSVIFQDMRLFPMLTTWENIELKRSQTNAVSPEMVSQWLNMLGIADKRDATASTLSFGEQQRVSIIRALAQPFRWLLMDEPFSHLDNDNRRKAVQIIEERAAGQQASLLLADLEPNDHFAYTQILKM